MKYLARITGRSCENNEKDLMYSFLYLLQKVLDGQCCAYGGNLLSEKSTIFDVDKAYKNVNQLVIGLINEKMEQIGYEQRIPAGIRDIKEKITEENI